MVFDELKIAKVIPLHKTGAKMNFLTIDQFQFYHFSRKFLNSLRSTRTLRS